MKAKANAIQYPDEKCCEYEAENHDGLCKLVTFGPIPLLVSNFLYHIPYSNLIIRELPSFDEIDQILKEKNVILFHGIGGIGKSTLAYQYTRYFLDQNSNEHCVKSFYLKPSRSSNCLNTILDIFFVKQIEELFSCKSIQNILKDQISLNLEKINLYI